MSTKIFVDGMVGAEMLRSWGIWSVVLVAVCNLIRGADGQDSSKPNEAADAYTLRLPVDEVVLTFNAMDAHGLPINDLKAGEILVWDNGVPPRRIVAFDELLNRPIRAGILVDTSNSMQRALPGNRAIAEKFVQRILRQRLDEAFVSEFGYASELLRPWTGDTTLLVQGIEGASARANLPGGTALFNAVFRACFYGFGKVDPTATGNFILLFSDGEDNSGLTSLEEAASACQRSNTQVFAFLPSSVQDHPSTGPRALRELATKTGGQVFLASDSDEAIWKDLKTIESKMRNQYRIVYSPANSKHDGAFHEITLQPPDRVSRVEVRSGYFAPTQ
ncbi:MAG: VWA domain-containing protein [Terracidiphilus sp.]